MLSRLPPIVLSLLCLGCPSKERGDDLQAGDVIPIDLPAPAEAGAADWPLLDLPPADMEPPPCPTPPCAARPIIFVHGFVGANDDWFTLLAGLVQDDPRYDDIHLSGVKDHLQWAPRSIGRRSWLFAFDYYIKYKEDVQGSYSSGPGRIGSNTAHSCADPAGNGYIIADKASYELGTTHDYAADLAEMVDSVLSATGASEVDLAAHSMGGMIVRSYLSFHGGSAKVRRVLLLASPVKGVELVGLMAIFPVMGQPSWMNDHEVAELNGELLVIDAARFTRCTESPASPSPWGVKLLDHELLHPPAVELYVLSGQLDPLIFYAVADHPLAKWHKVVALADHAGILQKGDTLYHLRYLLGEAY